MIVSAAMIVLILAFVAAVLAAAMLQPHPRIHLGWLAFTLYLAYLLLLRYQL